VGPASFTLLDPDCTLRQLNDDIHLSHNVYYGLYGLG
jgi:hypothetical protein